jgi:hypothetical protein
MRELLCHGGAASCSGRCAAAAGARAARPCVRAAPAARVPHRGPAPCAPPQRRVATAASVADSYDGYDDSFSATATYEDAYTPIDARSFILDKSGMVDYYQLL